MLESSFLFQNKMYIRIISIHVFMFYLPEAYRSCLAEVLWVFFSLLHNIRRQLCLPLVSIFSLNITVSSNIAYWSFWSPSSSGFLVCWCPSSELSMRPRWNVRAELTSSHTTCIVGLRSIPAHWVIFTGNSSTSQIFLVPYIYIVGCYKVKKKMYLC